LSQGELALAVGLSRNTVTDIELSRVNVSQDTLDILATFFHTSTDELLGRENSETPEVQMEELFAMCRGLTPVQQEAIVQMLELQLRAMGTR
jgi:transcriptional regulator with XRE-family HTH domain